MRETVADGLLFFFLVFFWGGKGRGGEGGEGSRFCFHLVFFFLSFFFF